MQYLICLTSSLPVKIKYLSVTKICLNTKINDCERHEGSLKFTLKIVIKLQLRVFPGYPFPCIFLFLIFNFSLLDPDLHSECGSRREYKCGSGSTALLVAVYLERILGKDWQCLFCSTMLRSQQRKWSLQGEYYNINFPKLILEGHLNEFFEGNCWLH